MARSRKSRRLRLPIAIGWGGDRSFSPSLNEWTRIEEAYGARLDPAAREEIIVLVESYLRFQPSETAAPFVDDAIRYLDDLEKAGSGFWRELLAQSHVPMTGKGDNAHIDQQTSRKSVAIGFVQSHFGRHLRKYDFRHNTDWNTLLDVMGGCMASFAATRAYLLDEAARVGFVEGTAWSTMIWQLSKYARQSGLPVGVSKHDHPAAASPFVRFIWELQKTLPEPFRRHDASYAALTEAISLSRRRVNKAMKGRVTEPPPVSQSS